MAGLPSKIDAQLRALARRKGIRAAEEQALEEERRRGIQPWGAAPTGLLGPDHRHVLLEGKRTPATVLSRTVMYDPVTDETVIVEPKGGKVVVKIGAALLRETLAESKAAADKLALKAADLAATTFAEGQGDVPASQWLVNLVGQAARRQINRYGIPSYSYVAELPREPSAVWADLEEMSVTQPWARPIGTNPGSCMNPRRRWVRL